MTNPSIWECMIQILPYKELPFLGPDNPHGTFESNYQHHFSVNVRGGVTGDQLIGPYIFPQHLTGDIYTNILQEELPALLETFPLQT
jgi:hypothetical protein